MNQIWYSHKVKKDRVTKIQIFLNKKEIKLRINRDRQTFLLTEVHQTIMGMEMGMGHYKLMVNTMMKTLIVEEKVALIIQRYLMITSVIRMIIVTKRSQ